MMLLEYVFEVMKINKFVEHLNLPVLEGSSIISIRMRFKGFQKLDRSI